MLPLAVLLLYSIHATNPDTHQSNTLPNHITTSIDQTDTTRYVYLPQEVKHAIFDSRSDIPNWSKKYPEFFAAKEEHNAGIHDVIKSMLDDLLTELPQNHVYRAIISDYYQDIENQQFILEQSPTHISQIEAEGMPTRFKRYKRFGTIEVNILEVLDEARFNGNALFQDVGILGSISIDKDVRIHGDQTIDGNLAIGKSLAVEGDATFESKVAITNNLAVAGNQTIGGDLTVANNLIVNGAPITGTPSVNNIGSGQGELVASSTATNVNIKTLEAGPNVTITNNADTVTITATLSGGTVSGPGSSTDQALVRFNGTSGAVIENSGVILDDTNTMSGITNLTATGTITAPTFNGNATSATTATTAISAATATNFSGTLVGDVTGTQAATVVNTVGGVTAANIATGSNRANAGTNANTANTLVARDASGNFAAGTITAALNGNATTATTAISAITATTATNFSGPLVGDVTGTQAATVVSTVAGVSAADVATGANRANAGTDTNTANTLVARDASGNFAAGTITAALNGNATTATTATTATNSITATTATNFSGSLTGDVTGTQAATVVSTVGGVTATEVTTGVNRAIAGTNANTANTLVARDASGNFAAGTITADLNGNAVTATMATTASNFSGPLVGDVTGTQAATVVSTVGGVTATNVATGANRAIAGTNANTPSTLVARDTSGDFSAGTITANLIGNATSATTATNATTATTATNFSGPLAGDVTGTQAATVVSTVGGVTAAEVTTGVNRAIAGTNANTADTLVARDASGDFSASTITATIITGLNSPINPSDATNKQYVDNAIQGLTTKSPARVLAANNVTISGVTTIDGVSVVAGNRVLLTAQTNGIQNGLWIVQAGAWVRPADFANGSAAANAFVFIQEGTTYADTGWVCTNNAGSDIVGTDALNWAQFSSAGQVTGQNLDVANLNNIYTTKVGNDLLFRGLIAGTNVTLTPSANNITVGLSGNVVTAPTGTTNAIALFSGTGSAITQSAAPVTINGANAISGLSDVNASGNINLAATTSATTGVISKESTRFIHNYGNNNIFAGLTAGNFTLTGSNNTALGTNALTALTSGTNTIAIGNNAGSTLTTGSNDIYIGAAAGSATEANTIRIGTNGTQTQTFIAGITGGASLANGVPVYIDSATGQLSTSATAAGVTSAIGTGTTNAIALFTGTGVAIKQSPAPVLIDSTNNITAVSTIKAANSAVGTPTYSFTSSPTSGIWSSGTNALDFATAGVNRMSINATGSVSILGSTAGSALTVTSAANIATPIAAITSTNNRVGLQVTGNGTGSAVTVTPAAAGPGITIAATTGNALTVNSTAFTVNGTSGNISTAANLNLTAATSTATTGSITKNGTPFVHNAGSNNFFAGFSSGNFTNTGANNVAVGVNNLNSLSSGNNNTVLGANSFAALTSGSGNIIMGSNVTCTNSTESSNNVILTNNMSINGSNNILISPGISGITAQNAIYLGNSSNTSIRCFAMANGTVSGSTLGIDTGTGRVGILPSSARFKEDIKDMGSLSSKIIDLRPVTFNYTKEVFGAKDLQYGLIAEEVAQVYPEMVAFDGENKPAGIKYHILDAMLLNELQKLMQENKEVKEKTAQLEADNKKHAKLIDALLTRIDQLAAKNK